MGTLEVDVTSPRDEAIDPVLKREDEFVPYGAVED